MLFYSLITNHFFVHSTSVLDNKKTWTNYFVYAYRGIAKHHCCHIRAKAHAIGMSINFYSLQLFQFWRISISKNKANAFLSNVFLSFVYFIGSFISLKFLACKDIKKDFQWLFFLSKKVLGSLFLPILYLLFCLLNN